MGARAREIDEIVDSNTFFHHLMMATSAHFVCDRWMLSNCCTCPAETETKCKTKSNSNSLIFSYSLSHHIRKFPFQLLTYRGEVLQQLIFFLFPFPLLSRGVNLSVTSSFPLPSPRVPFPVASRAAAAALLLPQQEARPHPPPQGPARHQAPRGPTRQQARPPLPRRHPRARCTHLPLRTRARQGRATA